MKVSIRNTVARICRMVGSRRQPRTRSVYFLGCGYDFAARYIEQRFRDGMTWENHGTVWEVDHIRPLASFDLTREKERLAASHYRNLQPLFVEENRTKAAKIPQQLAMAI